MCRGPVGPKFNRPARKPSPGLSCFPALRPCRRLSSQPRQKARIAKPKTESERSFPGNHPSAGEVRNKIAAQNSVPRQRAGRFNAVGNSLSRTQRCVQLVAEIDKRNHKNDRRLRKGARSATSQSVRQSHAPVCRARSRRGSRRTACAWPAWPASRIVRIERPVSSRPACPASKFT